MVLRFASVARSLQGDLWGRPPRMMEEERDRLREKTKSHRIERLE